MKNAINYYYNLLTHDVHQNKKNYFFSVESDKYILYELDRNEKEIKELYILSNYLIQKGFPFDRIIINKFNSFITNINNTNYILLKKINISYELDISEILGTNITINNIQLKYINRTNWHELWSRKIDSIEFLVKESGNKYKKVNESMNYYIGLAETAIALSRKINIPYVVVSHRKINTKNGDTDIYNPLNLVLDYPIRDLCEMYKHVFFEENREKGQLENIIVDYLTRTDEMISYAFLSRLIFPSYYFDAVEKIINNEESEDILKNIINKCNKFENDISIFYNIIRAKNKKIDIEWIKKM